MPEAKTHVTPLGINPAPIANVFRRPTSVRNLARNGNATLEVQTVRGALSDQGPTQRWYGLLALILVLTCALSPWPAMASPSPQIVAFFDPPGEEVCPKGWERVADAEGRLILAVDDATRAGRFEGSPIDPGVAPKHDHSFHAHLEVPHHLEFWYPPHHDQGIAKAGRYDTAGRSTEHDIDYPFIQFPVCSRERTVEPSYDGFPRGTVAFFQGSACPTGWNAVLAANGRLILPLPEGGTPGTVVGDPWSESHHEPEHRHRFDASFEVRGETFGVGAPLDQVARSGDVAIRGTTRRNSTPVVPFVSLLTCQKSSLPDTSAVPEGITIFLHSTACPSGWAPTPESAGRLIFGMPEGGAPAATFGSEESLKQGESTRSHSHVISGEVHLDERKTAIGHGPPHYHLGLHGTYHYRASTRSAEVELPYLSLLHCSKR